MSQKIHILDESVSNQIAAGEVVERPSSVVKELVENSLDAGGCHIAVELQSAGLRKIRIVDDGQGMGPEDLQASVKRHATSKLRSSSDLESIASFGFRGEALPSIASVSHFIIASRESGSENGYQLHVDGGQSGSLEPWAIKAGTSVEVNELFFNTPARLKFLKAASTETGRVQQDLVKLAMPHPETAFTLRQDGKLSLDFPKVKNIRERVGQALGTGFLANSLEVDFAEQGVRVTGWTGLPGQHRSNRSGQYLFVNRRTVEHRLLGFTLSQAYGSLIAHGRHSVAALFVELNHGDLDVNVHPAKREVRFRDERAVLDALRHAVMDALGKAKLMATYQLPRPSPVAAAEMNFSVRASTPLYAAEAAPSLPGMVPLQISAAVAPHQQASSWVTKLSEPVKTDWPVPLAQLHHSYILCQASDALVVVDQHAAHERVLYEAACRSLENGEIKSQRLLLPQKISPGPSAAVRLRIWIAPLAGLGLDVQDLGGDVFYLLSIPTFMKNVQIPALLQELLDDVGEELEKDLLGAFRREIAAQMACRAAVKAGQALTLEEMQQLMGDLSRCEIPWSCPHGRPPLVRLPLPELEKYFERR